MRTARIERRLKEISIQYVVNLMVSHKITIFLQSKYSSVTTILLSLTGRGYKSGAGEHIFQLTEEAMQMHITCFSFAIAISFVRQ